VPSRVDRVRVSSGIVSESAALAIVSDIVSAIGDRDSGRVFKILDSDTIPSRWRRFDSEGSLIGDSAPAALKLGSMLGHKSRSWPPAVMATGGVMVVPGAGSVNSYSRE
jgi:hypothetical protein